MGFDWKEDFEAEEISKPILPVNPINRNGRDRRDRRDGIYLQKALFC